MVVRKHELFDSNPPCRQHISGGWGLPCAWPDCPNGIPDNDIEWERLPVLDVSPKPPGWRDLGPDIDTRVRLDSFEGRERYFWKKRPFPWSLLGAQIRNHEVNRVHRPLYTSRRVYHYTTLDVLYRIVESQDFFLSDYAYLNDSSEVRHGQEIAREVFDEICSSLEPDQRSIFEPLLTLPPDKQPRICVGCFSFDRDSLSQWRGYTTRSELPVAIGVIPEDLFFRAGMPSQTTFYPVVYADQQKRDMTKCLFLDWVELYRRDCKETYQHDWRKHYEDGPLAYFVELFSMFKDQAFKDEHELRFVHREEFALSQFGERYKARRRFRVVGPLMRPYTTIKDLVDLRPKVSDREQPRIEFAEIVVGPHPYAQVAAAGIREFLDANDYREAEVSISSVPYR